MAYIINLPLNKDWEIETEETQTEDGDVISCYYANGIDPKKNAGYIEIYAGDILGSNAKTECLNNYDAAIGLVEGEPEPIQKFEIFCKKEAWYYDCEIEDQPAIVVCVEIQEGILAIITLSDKDEEKLDDLLSYVDENLSVTKE